MLKKLLNVWASEKFPYVIAVAMFGFGVFAEMHPITIMIYGYLVSKYSYKIGASKEYDKLIATYRPQLEDAKKEMTALRKSLVETNQEAKIMKQKLAEYENIS